MAWIGTVTGLGFFAIAWSVLAVFVAAAIRGYSGFGLSALLVMSLSLFLPPAEIVPVTLLLEAAASLALIPALRRELDWRIMLPLLAGAIPAVPAGAWLLSSLPDTAMRTVLSVLVLTASLLVWRGYVFSRMPGPGAHGAVGMVSGAMFGAAAIGGLPVVIYLLAGSVAAATTRAILALLLLLMGLYGAAVAGAFGLLTMESLWRFGLFVPPLLAGVAVGNHRFAGSSQQAWKRVTLVLLMLLAIVGLGRAIMA